MSTANLTDRDMKLRDAVLRQLAWDPEVDAGAIGVTAIGETVTLTGLVGTYSGKLAAERAVKRVRGVRAVANDIEVRLKLERPDGDIAADVARALAMRHAIPDAVQAAVHNGRVTLTGRVDSMFQSREAEKTVRHIRGVRHVANYITVAPQPGERDIRHRIAEAMHRDANIDARHVSVTISGDSAILTGRVRSWLQRDSAERAAADAPGITKVENRIEVEPEWLDEPVDELC